MNRKLGLALTLLMALFLTACASKPDNVAVVEDPTPTVDPNADPYGVGYSRGELEALGIYGNPLDQKVVYFEYNSSALDRKSEVIVSSHARHLGQKGGANVNLDGHADERGTRDYNLALGERRGQTVAQLMSSEGAASQIQVVSYGEERPVDSGHNEAAWQQNRRVEIKY